jgi:2-polyprenyl-6-methoxyphenol hydroxylase-like FAD-dependent oxidoreductase
MQRAEGHAVVLGAGMSGLLAARALADFFERVTVIERDQLPADARSRRGIPQGRHLHGLLPRGCQALESLFPGLVDELVGAGAPEAQFLRDVRFVLSGHELARGGGGVASVLASRPLLEGAVRAGVAALANVKIVDGCDVAGLVTDDGRVTGARIRHRAGVEEVVEAELVVDAMGRGGRTGAWLSDLGFDPPAEERINCDLTYVSRFLRMPQGALGSDQVVIVGPVPGRPRMMGLGAQEGSRWHLTLGGLAGERPPDDDNGFLAFAETVAPPDVYAAIRDAEPLTDLVTHRTPASIRRRYDRLRRFPAGLLVVGDALCSFNPVYGQGMTVAALEAEALQRCLQAGDRDLARRFFGAAADFIDPAWQMSAGGDLALPEIEGHRPLSIRVLNRYIARVHRAAEHDPKVAVAIRRVVALLDPPSAITTPAVVARVLIDQHRRTRAGRSDGPAVDGGM